LRQTQQALSGLRRGFVKWRPPAAGLHGVLVHAACLISTHCHEVITDVRGEYPDFLETLHRNLALCTKAYRGWPEEVFNKRSTGVHALLTPEAVIESIAYLIANPVEVGASHVGLLRVARSPW